MGKKIVYCADGTWDDPNNNSNVCQLYTALQDIDGVQLPMYDSGVGTNGLGIEKLLGGAVGSGLFQKIKTGYADIAARYEPGDQLFLFGFSRGAYTARSVAGMIAICGLPTKFQTESQCVDMAFEAYRNVPQRDMLLQTLNEQFAMDNAKIQLLGVWDTVGSLGIPALFGGIDPIQYGFLSTTLHPDVLNAVQALAIDERRMQFQPAIWTSAPAPGQTVVQVWFGGVHCDVGGGYPPDPNGACLSNLTLRWMAGYARQLGLQFKPGFLQDPCPTTHALATLHNSRTGAYTIFPSHVRNIDPDAHLAGSVTARCQDQSAGYSPENLHFVGRQLATTYEIATIV